MTATNRKTRVISIVIISIVVIAALIVTLWLNAVQNITQNTPVDTLEVSQTHTHAIASIDKAADLLPEGYEFVDFISEEKIQKFESAEQVLEEGVDYAAILVSSKGPMTIDLLEDAPNTINNFAFLALNHYFEDIVFHRVLEDFMAQTGDPTGTGSGGPGYRFEDEFTAEQTHSEKGILSMANSGPNTNGSQFFITFQETAFLDGRHAVFGKVTDGLDILDVIQRFDPASSGNSAQPDAVLKLDATLAEAKARGLILTRTDENMADDKTDEEITIEEYITETMGAMSVFQQQFELGEYKVVHGRIGGDDPGDALGFWFPEAPKPELDHIEAVYIIKKSE